MTMVTSRPRRAGATVDVSIRIMAGFDTYEKPGSLGVATRS